MIVDVILWYQFKKRCFHKTKLEICKQNVLQIEFFPFFKQVGSIFKSESANLSKKWLRIGLLVLILKYNIRINFSYLFDSLLIMVSGLQAKLGSLGLGGLYIFTTRILFLCIVIFIVTISELHKKWSFPLRISSFFVQYNVWSIYVVRGLP